MTDEQFHEMRSRAEGMSDDLREVSRACERKPHAWGLTEAQDALMQWGKLEPLLRAYCQACGER